MFHQHQYAVYTWWETIVILFIMLMTALVVGAIVIELETGKPAKAAITEKWSTVSGSN
jgi:hypothetical protein